MQKSLPDCFVSLYLFIPENLREGKCQFELNWRQYLLCRRYASNELTVPILSVPLLNSICQGSLVLQEMREEGQSRVIFTFH